MTRNKKLHFRAVRMLAMTTVFWSLSFPLVKALSILQAQLVPENSSWFHAGLTGFVRFGAAAVVLLLLNLRRIRKLTKSEIWQGVGLGFFGGGGILIQMDGLAYTSASTSAFVTQAFCIFVPIIVAIRDHAAPSARLVVAVAMMLAGVAVLSRFDPRTFHLGRGEGQTLIAAVFFAGQIVWLERPIFSANHPIRFSIVMFVVMSVMSAPIMAATWRSPVDAITCYADPGVIGFSAALILFSTIIAFVAMNKWQPFVPATEAAIIYGTEPVWASILTLFLPAWLSAWAAIHYPNETVTSQLLAGGALVIGANLLLQWKWRKARPAEL